MLLSCLSSTATFPIYLCLLFLMVVQVPWGGSLRSGIHRRGGFVGAATAACWQQPPQRKSRTCTLQSRSCLQQHQQHHQGKLESSFIQPSSWRSKTRIKDSISFSYSTTTRQRQPSLFPTSSSCLHQSTTSHLNTHHTDPPPPGEAAATTTAVSTTTTETEVLDYHYLQELNEAQRQAVTLPSSCIARVVAGPGSGKTRVLIARIAHLLIANRRDEKIIDNDDDTRSTQQPWADGILAVTFTRKAAGEMQERLERVLAVSSSSERDDDEGNEEETTHDDDDDDPDDAHQQQTSSASRRPSSSLLPRAVTLGTFHSVCAKILRWNGENLASLSSVKRDTVGSPVPIQFDGGFIIMDQGEQLRTLQEIVKEMEIDMQKEGVKAMNVLEAMSKAKSLYAQGKDPFQKPTKDKRGTQPLSKAMQIASKVYPIYRIKLLTSNCVDFDDLILMARELLHENPEVCDRLQRRWPHVLVDEFQDTSQSQLDLVKLLTSRSLFVVGDADQSIYSWRGAHVGSLSEFEAEFQPFAERIQQSVETVYLMENYRSTTNIVKAAQKVISSSSSKGESGADRMRQDMKPQRGPGAKPRILACADGQAEANFVIETIKDAIDEGTYDHNHEVAIIYRTNAQSRVLEEACVLHNVPYVIFGSATSFYKRREIRDCLCFLRWLYNGRDRGSMLRAMKTPARGIGEVAVREFDDYCNVVNEYYSNTDLPSHTARPTPLDVLISLSDADSSSLGFFGVPPPSESIRTRPLKLLQEFSLQMRDLRNEAYRQTLGAVLTHLIENFKLMDHFDKTSKSKSEFEERKANVEELQKAAQRFADDGPCMVDLSEVVDETEDPDLSPLGTFLDDVALVADTAEALQVETEQRCVARLMTIHASKGKEFESVFVVGNEDGTFPTSQSLYGDDGVQLEEERRLCYVAMTRAKTQLTMTWRKTVQLFTAQGVQTMPGKRSRFLDILVSNKEKASDNKAGKNSGTNSRSSKFPTTRNSSAQRKSRSAPTNYRQTSKKPYSTSAGSWGKTIERIPPKAPKFEGTNSIFAKKQTRNNGSIRNAPESPTRPAEIPNGAPRNSHRRQGTGIIPKSPRKAAEIMTTNTPPLKPIPTGNSREPQSPKSTAGLMTTNTPPPKPIPTRNSREPQSPKSTAGPRESNAHSSPPRGLTSFPHVASTTAWSSEQGSNNHATSRSSPGARIMDTPNNSPKPKKSPPSPPKSPPGGKKDSTWFFPVGSQVNHKSLGPGVVLPPPRESKVELPVRVQFSAGEEREFSARGSDIVPF